MKKLSSNSDNWAVIGAINDPIDKVRALDKVITRDIVRAHDSAFDSLAERNVEAEIENILDRLAVRMYDEGQLDKPSLMGRQVAIVNINEAKAQIMHLIDSAKREGAIEEMKMLQQKAEFMEQVGMNFKPAAHAHNRLIMLEQSEESI